MRTWIFWGCVIAFAFLLFFKAPRLSEMDESISLTPDVLRFVEQQTGWGTASLWLSLILAAIVFTLFYKRFDGWPESNRAPANFPDHTPRYFTTRVRYEMWAILYGALIAAVFLFIVYFPEFAQRLATLLLPLAPTNAFLLEMEMIAEPREVAVGELWSLPPAVAVAVVFAKSDWERSLRGFFQNQALIPRQAVRFFETTRRTLGQKAVDDKQSEAFVNFFRSSHDLPGYPASELELPQDQINQKRLELLPRLEYMMWRLDQDLPGEVRARLREHAKPRKDLSERLSEVRAEALRINREVVEVARVVLTHISEDRKKDVYAEFELKSGFHHDDQIRDVSNDFLDRLLSPGFLLPMSRLDDVLPMLRRELNNMGNGSASENETTDSSALRAVVPLAGKGAKTLNEALKALSAKLKVLLDDFLRYVICIGMATSEAECREFFDQMALIPAQGIISDFDFSFVLKYVVTVLLFFFVTVWVLPINNREHWLLFGSVMIALPLAHGCYLGNAWASARRRRTWVADEEGPKLAELVVGLASIWAVLIIGLSLVITFTGLSQSITNLYQMVFSFAAVPAVWGMLVATASTRQLAPETRPLPLGVDEEIADIDRPVLQWPIISLTFLLVAFGVWSAPLIQEVIFGLDKVYPPSLWAEIEREADTSTHGEGASAIKENLILYGVAFFLTLVLVAFIHRTTWGVISVSSWLAELVKEFFVRTMSSTEAEEQDLAGYPSKARNASAGASAVQPPFRTGRRAKPAATPRYPEPHWADVRRQSTIRPTEGLSEPPISDSLPFLSPRREKTE